MTAASGLRADFLLSMGGIKQPQLDRLRGLGISGQALIASGAIGMMPIRKIGRLFELAEDGEPHFISPVFDGLSARAEGRAWPDAAMVDHVAWSPDRPDRWWLRTDEVWALGINNIEHSGWFPDIALTLHATPLTWIRAGGEGAVILNWTAAWTRLDSIGKIICEDFEHAREIRRRLTPPAPPMPTIIYPKRRVAA